MGQKLSNKYIGIWHCPVLFILKLLFNSVDSQKSRMWSKNFFFLFWLLSRQKNLLFLKWLYFIFFLCRYRYWSRISTFSYFIYFFHCSDLLYLWKKNKKSKHSSLIFFSVDNSLFLKRNYTSKQIPIFFVITTLCYYY